MRINSYVPKTTSLILILTVVIVIAAFVYIATSRDKEGFYDGPRYRNPYGLPYIPPYALPPGVTVVPGVNFIQTSLDGLSTLSDKRADLEKQQQTILNQIPPYLVQQGFQALVTAIVATYDGYGTMAGAVWSMMGNGIPAGQSIPWTLVQDTQRCPNAPVAPVTGFPAAYPFDITQTHVQFCGCPYSTTGLGYWSAPGGGGISSVNTTAWANWVKFHGMSSNTPPPDYIQMGQITCSQIPSNVPVPTLGTDLDTWLRGFNRGTANYNKGTTACIG